MGKGQEYNYYVDHTKKKKKVSSCMPRFSRNIPTRGVWQLEVPTWEKQFCLKIGLFKWKDFLDAKMYSQYHGPSKIQDWDDSAAEKAFNHAKNRFFARFGGLQPQHDDDDQSMMDPNLYIDEINWDDDEQVDPDLLEELESAKVLPMDYGGHVEYPHPIRIQDIKPTGWDIDIEQLSQSNVLTGLIVGS